jgi:hypothetical protein
VAVITTKKSQATMTGMIVDEGQPTLFRVRRAHGTASMEVLADGGRGDLNGQLERQLMGDAFLLRRSLGI